MFANTWNNVVSWFKDRSERAKLVSSFNDAARLSFITGDSPTLLKASISKGYPPYKHHFSKFFSGFRIVAFSGRQLDRGEIQAIGDTIISDDTLVRRLVVLGWDTLEVQGDKGYYGLRWQLKEYMLLGN